MNHLYVVFTAITVALLCSCEHKDIEFDYQSALKVKVSFDWSMSTDSDADPGSMAVFFYSLSDNEMIRYDIPGSRGGYIHIPRGKYKAFCFNTDVDGVIYKSVGLFDTFEISTRESVLLPGLSNYVTSSSQPPRGENTEKERVALPVNRIWSGMTEDITITDSEIETAIVFYPDRRTTHYTIEIRNVQNMKYNTVFSGTVSSLSGGYMPGKQTNTSEPVTVPFDVSNDNGNNKINGDFYGFGCIPSVAKKHYLMMYAVLGDGRKWYYSYDITDQIHSAPDPLNVHIVLDGLPLPKPIDNGGGFHPVVDDWEVIEENIEM